MTILTNCVCIMEICNQLQKSFKQNFKKDFQQIFQKCYDKAWEIGDRQLNGFFIFKKCLLLLFQLSL